MKKIILLVCWLSVLSLFISCSGTYGVQNTSSYKEMDMNDPEDYSAYSAMTAYIDVTSVEGGEQIAKSEYVYKWVSAEKLPDPQKTRMSLTVLGKDYDGKYIGKKAMGYGVPLYVYKTDAGDEIEIDESGKITYYASTKAFSHYSKKVDETEAISPEQSLTLAKKYLQQLFGNETASRFSSSLPDTSTSKVWIHFKPIDNNYGIYSTSERITLVLSETGELLSYYAYNVNAFQNKTLPTEFNDVKVKEIINESLIDKQSSMDLSQKRNLVILPDGRMACSMSFRLMKGDTVGAWTSVLIPLE